MADRGDTRYAQSGDTYIAYQTFGDGEIPLLMSSYGTISIDAFDDEPHFAHFTDVLASFARIIRYDRRGIGLSDPIEPSSPPTLEQDAEDALAVLDDAGVESAALFGALMTGMAMMLLAASHPERASALVLVNTFSRVERALDYPSGFPPEMLRAFHDQVTRPGSGMATSDLLEVMSPSVADDERFARWWEDAGRRGASPATARALWSVGFFADVRDVLPSISVPTLVIHRRDSRWIRVGHGRYLGEHIPSAKYVEIDGMDGPPFTENADELLEEIEEFLTGERHDRGTDRVLATVVFTDIVRSTEQAAGLGDQQWKELLDRHDAMVRRQLHRFAGREVKTTGDGFLATFDGPARAIRFALAVRDGAGQLGVDIRAGVHSGEVELRGADVSGIAVNIGERITSLAGSREVFVSSTVKDLVVGSGIEFDDRGMQTLRGVPDEWRVFAVYVRLATIRLPETNAAVRLDGDIAVELGAPDVGALLQTADWPSAAATADGPRHRLGSLDYAPLVVRPDKIICVGLNYRHHILEMGRELPDYPTLFAKYTSSLIGARDEILLPAVSSHVDWEAELAVVIGAPARHVTLEEARAAIAGYTVCNDVSVRDYQNRTLQWLQGKTFESTTPLGPELVTLDDGALGATGFEISCAVDGELVQKASTADLVFGPAALVSYISDILTLVPGDVIATGTPGGVGHARTPPQYLEHGSVVVTRIEGVGECRNVCRKERLRT